MWEAAVWIAALGVVAIMAGFVIRSVPVAQPFVAGAQATLPAPPIVPDGQTCVIRGCPVRYPPGPPTRVRIPDIAVDSTLESLTLDAHKVLSAPVRYDEAGWYAQRQENEPTWSLPSCAGEVTGEAGVNVSGR